MTNDFHLFATPDDGEGPLDPDVALISAYLARELSPMQVLVLEERLATDEAFRTAMQPLLDAWAAPVTSLKGEARPVTPPSSIERAQSWQRFQREQPKESIAAAPLVSRRISMRRIAAIILMVVLPMVGFAQLVVYVATHEGVPGHSLAKALVPPMVKQGAPPSSPPATVHEGPTTRQLTLEPRLQQQSVPVVDVPAPEAKSTHVFGAILSVREIPDGRVFVNDYFTRQVLAFDRSLATSTVAIDSVAGTPLSYGRGNVPKALLPYIGDSLAFLGANINEILILDPQGKLVRAKATVNVRDGLAFMEGGFLDPRGRLVYKVGYGYARFGGQTDGTPPKEVIVPFSASLRPRPPGGAGVSRGGGPAPTGISVAVWDLADSLRPIRRVDFDARRADTIGFVSQPRWGLGIGVQGIRNYGGGRLEVLYDKSGAPTGVKQVINPLYYVDDWAMLSDGTVAIVRGRDYHVDWIHLDGSKTSSPKLPYDWKRLTDDDKQRLADSAKADVDSVEAWAKRREAGKPAPGDSIPMADTLKRPDGRGRCANPKRPGLPSCPYEPHEYPWEIVPLSQIADYYPPTRSGTTLADADGNLWILPRTSSLSRKGELVYDVVNPKRGMIQRVRLPLGRSIAGFGKGGSIYLQMGDLNRGFTLERAVVPGLK